MQLQKNFLANSLGQIYFLLVNLFITPLYLYYLGPESFGMVGLLTLMLVWLTVLDVGLSPTLSREVSFSRGIKKYENLTKILKSFELIFAILFFSFVLSIYLFSDLLSTHWVQSESLDNSTIKKCLILMSIISGLRLCQALYKSGIIGFEDQVWLNKIYILMTSLRYFGSLFIISFYSKDIVLFFLYQAFITLIELMIYIQRLYKLIPNKIRFFRVSFNLESIKNVAPFASGVAFTSALWVLVSQTDKLVLSNFLNLEEYGYFSLIAIISGSITLLAVPFAQAITPRLTKLYAEKDLERLRFLYSQSSQYLTLFIYCIALNFALFSEQLIFAWTGNQLVSNWGSNLLILYSVGNAFFSITAFQYYLQSAFGNLNLHIKGSLIFSLIQLPVLFILIIKFGAIGAGLSWLSLAILWFIVWSPIVHIKFLPGLHANWLIKICTTIFFISLVSFCFYYFVEFYESDNRAIIFFKIFFSGLFSLIASSLFIKEIRKFMTNRLRKLVP
tara:strand:+ start:4807 stop:6312 length:1506 start_codon:yes stop_codon:yes gene_type:complete